MTDIYLILTTWTNDSNIRYTIPKALSEHVAHIFNTIQLPPIVTSHENSIQLQVEQPQRKASQRKNQKKSQIRTWAVTPQDVTIPFLNGLYAIPNNNGSSTLSQSVFETNQQYYSAGDLALFQQLFGITPQAAELIGGFGTSSCSLISSSGNDCFEANLDTQYIMGISQNTSTRGKDA